MTRSSNLILLSISVLLSLFVLKPAIVYADSSVLAWDPPTTNAEQILPILKGTETLTGSLHGIEIDPNHCGSFYYGVYFRKLDIGK